MSFKKLIPPLKTASAQICAPILKTKTGKKIYESLGFRDYDMPLEKSEDSRFLILLIALMSFLAVLAGSGTFALNAMSTRWSSGLENKITIEIPVETKDGHLLSSDTVKEETLNIAKALKENPNIKSSTVMSAEEIQDLISPWIGSDLKLNDIPLPGLIAVELNKSNPEILDNLKKTISETSPYANLETHHEWLTDLINFTKALKTLALFITFTITITTLIAIIAGIRARLTIHKKEVELLHSMGASDIYIARQFQRHAMIIGFQGAALGTVIGLIITFIIISISAHSETSLIPTITISTQAITMLCIIPFIATLLSAATARITVLRSLSKMP
ncbi:MAG: cell division protein FtsX [Alphaproteobacteria bacterium]